MMEKKVLDDLCAVFVYEAQLKSYYGKNGIVVKSDVDGLWLLNNAEKKAARLLWHQVEAVFPMPDVVRKYLAIIKNEQVKNTIV